jgi:hypothetical protein
LHEGKDHFDAYAGRAAKRAELEAPGAPIARQACAIPMTYCRRVAAGAGIGSERSSAARVDATDIARQVQILFSGRVAAQTRTRIEPPMNAD